MLLLKVSREIYERVAMHLGEKLQIANIKTLPPEHRLVERLGVQESDFSAFSQDCFVDINLPVEGEGLNGEGVNGEGAHGKGRVGEAHEIFPKDPNDLIRQTFLHCNMTWGELLAKKHEDFKFVLDNALKNEDFGLKKMLVMARLNARILTTQRVAWQKLTTQAPENGSLEGGFTDDWFVERLNQELEMATQLIEQMVLSSACQAGNFGVRYDEGETEVLLRHLRVAFSEFSAFLGQAQEKYGEQSKMHLFKDVLPETLAQKTPEAVLIPLAFDYVFSNVDRLGQSKAKENKGILGWAKDSVFHPLKTAYDAFKVWTYDPKVAAVKREHVLSLLQTFFEAKQYCENDQNKVAGVDSNENLYALLLEKLNVLKLQAEDLTPACSYAPQELLTFHSMVHDGLCAGASLDVQLSHKKNCRYC